MKQQQSCEQLIERRHQLERDLHKLHNNLQILMETISFLKREREALNKSMAKFWASDTGQGLAVVLSFCKQASKFILNTAASVNKTIKPIAEAADWAHTAIDGGVEDTAWKAAEESASERTKKAQKKVKDLAKKHLGLSKVMEKKAGKLLKLHAIVDGARKMVTAPQQTAKQSTQLKRTVDQNLKEYDRMIQQFETKLMAARQEIEHLKKQLKDVDKEIDKLGGCQLGVPLA